MTDAGVSRRDIVVGGLALSGIAMLSGGRVWAQEAGKKTAPREKSTPTNILGPYYRSGAPKTDSLRPRGVDGLALTVSGRVTGTGDHACPDAVLEIWHADADGQYDNEGFRFRGTIPVDAKGGYQFETVLPGHYSIGGYGVSGGSRRPQHLHYRIAAPGHVPLVTQLYFETDPFFRGDPGRNLHLDPFVKHRELVVPVLIHRKRKVYSTSAKFDVVLRKQ